MAPLDGFDRFDARTGTRKPEELPEGVLTEQKTLLWIFGKQGKDVQPIATDQFLNKSKDQYNPAWVTRELAQNFVDHNPDAPGTLNGVQCRKTVRKDGTVRFEIEGAWSYRDVTGAISPHSEKPTDRENAGGNGIGLKQTAIRLLRDFDVETFELHGEKWKVSYHLARAENVNADIARTLAAQGQSSTVQLKHDWLVGELTETSNTGICRYIIETKNPAVIKALDTFEAVGVSDNNPFLKNPDFANGRGSLKWLLPDTEAKPTRKKANDQFDTKAKRGRLFINGQVMSWDRKGATDDDYWVGPEFLTLQLNNLKYDMTIDRPPVRAYDLTRYVEKLVASMKRDDLIDQLKRSEPIWSTQQHGGAWSIVVNEMVHRLKELGFKPAEFSTALGEKKYLAYDTSLSSAQEEEFVKQGYILCPPSFREIGMQRASVLLSESEQARRGNKPDAWQAQEATKKLAAEVGIQVLSPEYPCRNARDFAELIRTHLSTDASGVEYLDINNTIRLSFPLPCSTDLMYDAFASASLGKEGALMYKIRGCLQAGINTNVLTNGYITNGDLTAIFGANNLTLRNTLFMKIIKSPAGLGWSVDFVLEENAFKITKGALTGVKEEVEARPEPPPRQAWSSDGAPAPEVYRGEAPRRTPEAPRPQYQGPPIPGLQEAVGTLEEIAGNTKKRGLRDTIVDQYRKLRGNNGNAASEAGYLSGRHLLEILHESSEADVPASQRGGSELSRRLEYLANQIREADEQVENLDIVLEPSKQQLGQLAVLRKYLNLTTGVAIENDLFVFRGRGTLGINIARRAIGLHEAVFKTSFKEAQHIMTHELAHNEFRDHDVGFMTMMQSLFVQSEETVYAIATKLLRRQRLTKNERVIMSLQEEWEKLRT